MDNHPNRGRRNGIMIGAHDNSSDYGKIGVYGTELGAVREAKKYLASTSSQYNTSPAGYKAVLRLCEVHDGVCGPTWTIMV